jgi:apolipoprotein N-acyltransferase
VRAANTGISAIIAPDGTLRDRLALDTAGYLDARLPAALPPTPYSRVGNLSVWAVLALVAGALLAGRRRGGLAA